jgi:hypothetical protein
MPQSNGAVRISAHQVPVTGGPVLSEWSYPEAAPRSRGNGLVITAAVVFLLGLAVLLYSYREVLGQSLISLGQKMSTAPDVSQPQTSKTPEPSKPAVETQPAVTPVPVTPQPQAGSSQPPPGNSNDSSNSVRDGAAAVKPDSSFEDARRGPAPTAAGSKDYAAVNGSADQIRSLWSAVAQGNTSAEVTLGKLYLIGAGVPKSCDQAKILFQAAAKKGNGEAIDKLSQIIRHGCP